MKRLYQSQMYFVEAEAIKDNDWYRTRFRGEEGQKFAHAGDYRVEYPWGDVEIIPKKEFEYRFLSNV